MSGGCVGCEFGLFGRCSWCPENDTQKPQGGDQDVRTMPLADLLRDYRDGDELGWEEEFAYLRTSPEHRSRLGRLFLSVIEEGIREPILLGYDGRVWDGHHRLCVASEIGLQEVPVKTVRPPVMVEWTAFGGHGWECPQCGGLVALPRDKGPIPCPFGCQEAAA